MSKLSIFFLVLQLVVFLGLGVVNPLLEPLNMRVRLLVDSTRNMKLRPLMILTHRYNDIVSLSVQLLLLAGLVGLLWQDWRRAMVLTSAMFVQTTVVSAFKRLTSVVRPPQELSHVFMTSGSYPSGHSSASLTFALLVPAVLAPHIPFPFVVVIAVYLYIVALLTAYGRLYLDVHWLSDIIGGWMLAGATYMLSLIFLS